MTTIVVVDDETTITDFLCYLLKEEGFDVFAASDGRAALDLIELTRPDLIVTDFMMPIMSGLDLARALKADDAFSKVPIILATAAQGAIARSNATLFAAILDKPYPLDELLCLIRELSSSR
ncbi:response regulator [Caballeronia sp. GAFFF1]|uniref:response regulator n=1 Tax=Caballeronia sp. GAFFF1 TaxID=2921779 RepID=UPI002028506F|nr:response regulator [Caballeronia sp. GAFFF1]